MSFGIFLFLLSYPTLAYKCHCNSQKCLLDGVSECSGGYCYTFRELYPGPITETGCVKSQIPVSGCELDRKSSLLCVCEQDYCNTEELAETGVKSLPIIKCTQLKQGEESNDSTCSGSFCMYSFMLSVNVIGDFSLDPTQETRGCDNEEKRFTVDYPPMGCELAVNGLSEARITCYCNTDYCNKKMDLGLVLGKHVCYAYEPGFAVFACRGDYCTVKGKSRGCLTVSNPIKQLPSNASEMFSDNRCMEDYCNGIPVMSARKQSFASITVLLILFCADHFYL